MIGGDHDHGVLEHAALGELVDELAEPVVGHGDQSLVAALQVILRLGVHVGSGDALVLGNLEIVAVEPAGAAVHLHVLVRDVEGLVRIEGLDHEEEVIGPGVAVDPVAGGLEGLGTRHVLLARPQLTVLLILLAHAPVEGLGHVVRLVDAADPRVALLAAVVVPGVELLQIALTTGTQVVAVVGCDVAEVAVRAQAGGQRHVEGLDGTPGALKEVIAAGEDVAAGGHARRRADPVVVEHAGLVREGIEVGRLDIGRGVVARQDVAAQGIHEHENSSHWDPFIWRATRRRRRIHSASAPWRASVPGGRKGPRPTCGSRASNDLPYGKLAIRRRS